MKLREIMETASVGATAAGGIAPVAQPLGSVISRVQKPRATKYQNSAPITGTHNAKRRSQNTTGH